MNEEQKIADLSSRLADEMLKCSRLERENSLLAAELERVTNSVDGVLKAYDEIAKEIKTLRHMSLFDRIFRWQRH